MEQKGPFCQSCSMPMEKPEDFGIDDDGFRINDYCRYCFQNGKFTNPDITLDKMIDISVSHMVEHMPEEKAREILNACIPNLKRWRK